eukprot:g61912.t1
MAVAMIGAKPENDIGSEEVDLGTEAAYSRTASTRSGPHARENGHHGHPAAPEPDAAAVFHEDSGYRGPDKFGIVSTACDFAHMPVHVFQKVRYLSARFGARFLLMVIAIQWLTKGFGLRLLMSTASYMYRDIGGIEASELSIYQSMVASPFAIKPLMGIQSDFWAVYGWQKYTFLVFWNIVAICVSGATLFTWYAGGKKPLSAMLLTGAGLLYCYYVANADLLLEAVLSEKIKRDSSNGPSLVSFMWGGMFAVGVLTSLTAGEVTQRLSPWFAWLFALAVALIALPPTWWNWTGERPQTEGKDKCLHFNRDKYEKERQLFNMALVCSVIAIGFVASGFIPAKYKIYQLAYTILAGTCLMAAAYVLLPKWIFRVCFLNFISGILSPSVSSASYYFYTDSVKQYADGPHFSAEFYISTIGIVGGVVNVFGIVFFERFMKGWRYRSILILANVLMSACNLINILIYTRANLKLGITDKVFVLGEDVFQHLLGSWTWIPSMILISQLCPKGMEASAFAVTAGIANLGGTSSAFGGSFLLYKLGIRPTGAENEDAQFEKLWLASLIASLLPMVTILLIPYCVPEGKMTDDLSHLLDEGRPGGKDTADPTLKQPLLGREDSTEDLQLAVPEADADLGKNR